MDISEEVSIYGIRYCFAMQVKVKEGCRRIGISVASFYNWKMKFVGPIVNEVTQLQ